MPNETGNGKPPTTIATPWLQKEAEALKNGRNRRFLWLFSAQASAAKIEKTAFPTAEKIARQAGFFAIGNAAATSAKNGALSPPNPAMIRHRRHVSGYRFRVPFLEQLRFPLGRDSGAWLAIRRKRRAPIQNGPNGFGKGAEG